MSLSPSSAVVSNGQHEELILPSEKLVLMLPSSTKNTDSISDHTRDEKSVLQEFRVYSR